jgi:hypothetical protein
MLLGIVNPTNTWVKAKIYDAWESNSLTEKYKKSVEGTKLKQKLRDGKTGASYQKHGHCSDASDYFICELLKLELQNFKKKMKRETVVVPRQANTRSF